MEAYQIVFFVYFTPIVICVGIIVLVLCLIKFTHFLCCIYVSCLVPWMQTTSSTEEDDTFAYEESAFHSHRATAAKFEKDIPRITLYPNPSIV